MCGEACSLQLKAGPRGRTFDPLGKAYLARIRRLRVASLNLGIETVSQIGR
jgi:hypothetical protein